MKSFDGVILLTAAALLPHIAAWYPCYPAPLTLAQLIGEPECPTGQDALHSYVELLVPDHPPAEVWGLVGDFQNLTWQGAPNITYAGPHNAPNNSHTQVTPDGDATEVLDIYAGPAFDPPRDSQTLYFMKFHLQPGGLTNLGGIYFTGIQDLILATKNGSGTTLSWETSGCSNTSDTAGQLYSKLHLSNINNTITIFNGGTPNPPPA